MYASDNKNCTSLKGGKKSVEYTFRSPTQMKLIIEDSKQMQTTPKMETLVFANMEAPIKQTIKFNVFRTEQYKNLHHSPS